MSRLHIIILAIYDMQHTLRRTSINCYEFSHMENYKLVGYCIVTMIWV
jgi:hypothetical protein